MPSLKDLRRRIRSVNNTKLITRAMRSVAASKMRKTQDRRDKIKPFAERLQEIVVRVIKSVGSEGQPLKAQHDTDKRLLVIFSSDRGLCGAFNNTIIRYASDYAKTYGPSGADLYIIGNRAHSYFKKREFTIVRHHTDFAGNIDTQRILDIARDLKDLFLEGQYNQVELIFNHAVSAMTYRPSRLHFLPLSEEELTTSTGDAEAAEDTDYIFEPDPKTLLSELLPKYVETKIYFTFVDAFATEHQARMLAMSAANENCIELLDALTLQMNKARQTAITKEILEIVGGAEALKG